MFMRIALFVITNILVITAVSIIAALLGIDGYVTESGLNYGALLVFCFLWGMVGSFISLAISRWVAKRLLGVKVLTPGSAGEQEWLVELVHNTAKKAQLEAMPEVGVYQSDEPNAFATGPSKKRSLVAFSSNILQQMDRDAIEGVIAHEIAHIANGDMLTLVLVQGVINAFVMFFARIVAWAASQAVDEKLSGIVWYVVVITAQIAFGLLGMLVTCWFSRKREFRADALSGKIAGREKMLAALRSLQNIADAETEPLPGSMAAFGVSGKAGGLLALWHTHPPLEKRIAHLERGIEV